MANAEHRPVILINMAVDVVNRRECEVLISQYAQRVADAGGVPMLIPSIEDSGLIGTLLDMADGVLLIGGKDYDPRSYGEGPHPETDLTRMRPHFDLAFGAAVLKRDLPVLGICAGCQLLAIVTGNKLIQHLDNASEHRNGARHAATVVHPGFLARALETAPGTAITVNSFHHQAVDPDTLDRKWIVSARAFDGTVEALELPGERMVLGVQFHPERMEDIGPRLFGLLTAEAGRRRPIRAMH